MNSRPYSTSSRPTPWWRPVTVLVTAFAMLGAQLLEAQTVTITCTGLAGSLKSGSVNSAGTKNDGNMTTINSVANRGWGHFDLSSIPNSAIVSAVTANFTTYSTTLSGVVNNVYGFTGDPAIIAGATLYANCLSGASLNASTWSANALQTKVLNASGIAFVQANVGTNNANIGYVRGSTNTYNIGGYPAIPAAAPSLVITYSVPSPCNAVPAPGNTTGPVAICPSTPFTVGLQNATSGSGVSYQWQFNNGGGWTNFGTNAPTQSVSQAIATSYHALVTCAGNGTTQSNDLAVAQNSFISCYCIPTTTNGCTLGDHITNVSFATINNTTGVCLSASYSDYTAISTTVGQTTNTPISVTINNGGTEYGGAWIDYDQSGTFDAAEFIVLNGGLGQGGGVFSGTASVPISALLGPTRLRARSSYNAAVAPGSACATYSYGETEDYTVNITTPPSCISPAVSNSGVTANSANIAWTCGGCTGTYYVEYGLSGFTPGSGAAAGVGGTIWTGGPVGASPVTITGLSSTTSYTVYVRQNCGGPFSLNNATTFTTLLDCSTAPFITCGTPVSFTNAAGTGVWNLGPAFCSPPGTGTGPYCTPGTERVWQFTAAFAGTYVLNTTATNSQWVDFFYKLAGGPCNQTGWTYIDDVISPQSFNFTIPAAGTYYILADLEGTLAASQTFNITCPLPCATPQFPFAQNVTSTGAQIAWTCTGCTGSLFSVEYGPSGFTPGTGTVITSATSPATIPPGSLTPVTPYQAYVTQNCNNVGDGLSNPSAVVNFTTLAAPPANDDCVNAVPVICGNSYAGSNVAATNDGLPSQASGGEATVDNGVWYVYTPTASGEQVTASLCTGTAFDTRIHIFQGSCGTPVGVAGSDDNCGVQSSITWNAIPGTTYYIIVEGYFTGSGTFNLAITCGPLCNPFVTNDLCVNRTVITMSPNCNPFGGNLSCATNSAGNNPACIGGFSPYPDAYYQFVATAPDAFVTLTGGANLRFVLYNNTCTVTAGTEVYCSAAVTSGTPTLVTGLITNNTYVLRVMQLQANAAPFTLCVQKIDVTDNPCTVIPLVCNDQRFGRTVGRLNNLPVGACPFNGAASTGGVNYFSYTALADEDVTFSTCGLSTFDSRISAFTGTCTSLVCNVMNDNAPGCPNSSSTVQIRAVTGQTYTIMVHGTGAAEGNYQITVFCQPYCSGTEANDRCTAAAATTTWVAGDPGAVTTTETLVCSYLDGPTSCSAAQAVQGVWFTLQTNAFNTDYDVYLASNVQNPAYTAPTLSMALYSGACSGVGATGELLCVASAGGTTQLPPLTPSTTYRILVYNQGSISEGTFGLQITRPGFNDGGITAITVPSGTVCDQRFSPVITLTNFGEGALSSAQIISRIDGGVVQTYNWSGPALATGASTTVTLPLVTSPFGLHSFSSEVVLVNGQPDELASNSSATSLYDATGQTVKVTISTDANPQQTTWVLYDAFFFPVATGGPYSQITQSNQEITTSVCLATTFGNCFYFYVFDSAGDGIVNGQWGLSDTQNRNVLQDNGAFLGQSPSTTPASPIYFAHEFCLPLGPSPIEPSECNVFNNFLNNKVYTTAVAGVTSYQFEFSDPNAGFYRRISLPRNWVKFGEMVSTPLVFGRTYFARARADQGAAGFSDDYYGAGCEMALAASQPICTELISTPGPTFSCGVTKTFGGSAKIWAQPVTYATQYRFKFVGMIDPDGPNPILASDTIGVDNFNDPPVMSTRNIVRTSYVCPLSWSTYTLVSGQTYNVSVECFVGGTWTGFCGAVCQVSILNPPGAMQLHDGSTEPLDADMSGSSVSLWPNPVRDGGVNIMIGEIADEEQMITVDIYDAFGKRVMAQHFENSGAVFNRTFDLDASMAAGTYVVKIAVNNEIHVKRLSVVR